MITIIYREMVRIHTILFGVRDGLFSALVSKITDVPRIITPASETMSYTFSHTIEIYSANLDPFQNII